MAHTNWIPGEDRLGDLICSGSPEQIARAFHPQVDRIVRRTLRRPHDPDLLVSATSDALLAVCRYRSGFRRESSASTFVSRWRWDLSRSRMTMASPSASTSTVVRLTSAC